MPRDGTPLRWCLEHAGAWLDPAAFALLSGDAATLLRGTLSIERRTECPAEHLAAALWPPTPADHTAWMPDYRDVLALRQVVLQCTS